MAVRNIIEIDEALCNGCGKCVSACAEGAIQMVNGKAKLVSDVYCDGLGACIGDCPTNALKVIQREAIEFDEEKVNERLTRLEKEDELLSGCPSGGGCPGSAARAIAPKPAAAESGDAGPSQLGNWPLQLHLVSPQAPYFQNADLLIAADCTAFAYAGFHRDMLSGKPLVIACPKLDDTRPYTDKLAQLIAYSELKSITVVHMEVPCCTGLLHIAKTARDLSGSDVPLKSIVVGLRGDIINEQEL